MKKVVLFGSGTVAEQNLHLSPEFIVDNNPDLQAGVFHDIEIKHPRVLEGKSDSYDVIVCTTSVREVRNQLHEYGYTWGQNAREADILIEKAAIADLEETRFRFLISSGLPSSAESFSGGGIHLVEENGDYPLIKNIYEGNTHGLIRNADGFAFSCQGKGVFVLNSEFEVIHQVELKKGLRPHGLRRYKNLWVLACSTADCVVGVNDNGKEVFRYPLSEQMNEYGSAQHHCNDLEIVGDSAYVSMFSVTGNWKRGTFDGGVIKLDLNSGLMTTVSNTLTMPHNVAMLDDGFYILDSFKGRLLGPDHQELAQLPGFTRGFDQKGNYYFVGESKNRNFSRLETGRTPVSIDSRITIINTEHGFSRSIPLPMNVSEIHSLILLDSKPEILESAVTSRTTNFDK